MIEKQTPSWRGETDAKKFFYDAVDDNGDPTRKMMRFVRSVVVVTTAYGDQVAFMGSNRSETFRDSRESKNKRLSRADVFAELLRLLDDPQKAQAAMETLAV